MNRKNLIITLMVISIIISRVLLNREDQMTVLTIENQTNATELTEATPIASTSIIMSENTTVEASENTTVETSVSTANQVEPLVNIRAYSPETDTYYTLDAFNQLDKETLMTFNGVGEVTADAILKYRKENGPFKTFSELMEIKGIGEKKLAKILSENP